MTADRDVLSDRLKREACPTCGGAVVVHSSTEGTSHYVPANTADQAEAFIERDRLRDENERLREALAQIASTTMGDQSFHRGFGRACGLDTCGVCLVDGVARTALAFDEFDAADQVQGPANPAQTPREQEQTK